MNEKEIAQALAELCLVDDEVKHSFAHIGLPAPRIQPEGFETLLSIIVSQLLSTKVAAVIMARVVALMPEVKASELLKIDDQTLRDAGLSWRKVEYAKGLANAVLSGEFNMTDLSSMSDAAALKEIMKLRGFGRWSAEIYLMFSLGRTDIFPADDLGILVGLGKLKGLSDKPTAKEARLMIEHWSPNRSAGALFLWHYYHSLE